MDTNEHILEESIDIETMSKEQEQAAFAAIRSGDCRTKERLIQGAMKVAKEIAGKCESSEAEFDELFSEAIAALIEAVHNFDCKTGERFSSYLTQCIEQRMQDCYANLTWLLPIDYRVVQLHDRYEEALYMLYPQQENPEDDAVQDEGYVADFLGVSVDELRAMKAEYGKCRNEVLEDLAVLEDELNDYNDEIEDDDCGTFTRARPIPVPKTAVDGVECLIKLMDGLSIVEKYIVCAKHGVLSVMERPDESIAAQFSIQTDELEVIYQKAIEKIRKARA